MVSTRTKYKFSDGEKVLCYEPDKTKAKVLYDSKVLEVIDRKDSKGHRKIEYLIHFQGWNSSWDRCVSEEYVLKDTEENRKLQRDLAARSRLHIGAYLYRKDQKKRKPSTLSEKVLEASNSCSSQEAGSTEDHEYISTTDDDKDSSGETDKSAEQRLPLELGPTIQELLEFDEDIINLDQKLVKLPASPNVVQILEDYVRYFCCSVLQREDGPRAPRSRNHLKQECPPEKRVELDWVCSRVNLCKEMVDGLRVCFDNYLRIKLLYQSEIQQYEEFRSGLMFYFSPIKTEVVVKEENCPTAEDSIQGGMLMLGINDIADTERRRSLRSHKDSTTVEPSVTANPGANGISKILRTSTASHPALLNHCSALSTSSTSSYYAQLAAQGLLVPEAGYLGAEVAKLMKLTRVWGLIPDSYANQQPQPPCVFYGGIHLARLCAQLPTLLYEANLPENEGDSRFIPERKLLLLLDYLQSFFTYMESKQEWFSQNNYISVQ